MTPGRQPLAASSPMQEALESLGIVRHMEDTLDEIGVVRPNPAQHLDFSHSQMLDASDYDQYEAHSRGNVPKNTYIFTIFKNFEFY